MTQLSCLFEGKNHSLSSILFLTAFDPKSKSIWTHVWELGGRQMPNYPLIIVRINVASIFTQMISAIQKEQNRKMWVKKVPSRTYILEGWTRLDELYSSSEEEIILL